MIDSATGKPFETIRYTAFGQESLFDATREEISISENPWRFSSKRVDPESGLIYFGRRYFDPILGRWITPDPIGFSDGPNLYAYLHHSPLSAVDCNGLFGETLQNAFSTDFDRPYFSAFSEDFKEVAHSLRNERSSYISENMHQAAAGIAHGAADAVTSQVCFVSTFCCAIGAHEWEDPSERYEAHNAFMLSQSEALNQFDASFAQFLGADPNHPTYQAARLYTGVAIEVGSLAIGGYGIARCGYSALSSGTRAAGSIMMESGCAGQKIALAAEQYAAKGCVVETVNRNASFAGSRRLPLDYAPYQTTRNSPAVINGRGYSGHALDRMQDRGLFPSMIENSIINGESRLDKIPGRIQYYDSTNKIRVITEESGTIVTIIPGRG